MAEQEVQLNPVNLTEQQTEEFFRVYRILTSDKMELDDWIKKQKKEIEMAKDHMSNLENIIELIEEHGDDKLKEFGQELSKTIKQTNDYITNMETQIETYEEKNERADKFLEVFKSDITMLENGGDCEVGEAVQLLVEYLNSLGHIMEPEEREKLQKQQQQTQQYQQ